MKELIDIATKEQWRKYPNIPDHALPKIKYSDRTANGLTKCIIDFLRLQGWQAERISTTGRYLDQSKTYIDVLGHTRIIGAGKWIPTSGQKGSADIAATIAGRGGKPEFSESLKRAKITDVKTFRTVSTEFNRIQQI